MKPLQCACQSSAHIASDFQSCPSYAMISSDHLGSGLPILRCPVEGVQFKTICDHLPSVRLTSSPAKLHFCARACSDHESSPKATSDRSIARAHRCINSTRDSNSPVVRLKMRKTYLSIFLLAISSCSAIPLVIAQVHAPYNTVVLTTASNKRKRDRKSYSLPVSSRLKLWNLPHPAEIRFCISVA